MNPSNFALSTFNINIYGELGVDLLNDKCINIIFFMWMLACQIKL